MFSLVLATLVAPTLLSPEPQLGRRGDRFANYGGRSGNAVEDEKEKPIVLKPGDRVRMKGSNTVMVVGENGLLVPIVASAKVNARPTSKVAEVALRYLGTPYLWGGTDLKKGIDTSHFVAGVLREAGMKAPEPPIAHQEQKGRIVHWKRGKAMRGPKTIEFKTDGPSLDVLRPGDRIIIQRDPLDQRVGGRHAALYIGEYDGPQGHFRHAIVHAGSRGVAVVDFQHFWKDYRYTVRD